MCSTSSAATGSCRGAEGCGRDTARAWQGGEHGAAGGSRYGSIAGQGSSSTCIGTQLLSAELPVPGYPRPTRGPQRRRPLRPQPCGGIARPVASRRRVCFRSAGLPDTSPTMSPALAPTPRRQACLPTWVAWLPGVSQTSPRKPPHSRASSPLGQASTTSWPSGCARTPLWRGAPPASRASASSRSPITTGTCGAGKEAAAAAARHSRGASSPQLALCSAQPPCSSPTPPAPRRRPARTIPWLPRPPPPPHPPPPAWLPGRPAAAWRGRRGAARPTLPPWTAAWRPRHRTRRRWWAGSGRSLGSWRREVESRLAAPAAERQAAAPAAGHGSWMQWPRHLSGAAILRMLCSPLGSDTGRSAGLRDDSRRSAKPRRGCCALPTSLSIVARSDQSKTKSRLAVC